MVKCPDIPSGPGCEFVGRGATLSAARRAVRGHALRVHGHCFDGEDRPLRSAPPAEIAERLTAFRRQQMSAGQRRAFDSELSSALGCAGFEGGFDAGPRAGVVDLSGDLPPWMDAFLPDLSMGQVDGPVLTSSEPTPASVASVGVEVFRPPRGFSPSEMAEFLILHSGRRPASIVRMLLPSAEVLDPATVFWVSTMAHLQRSLAARLRDRVADLVRIDPTGTAAYEEAMKDLSLWIRRPTGDDD